MKITEQNEDNPTQLILSTWQSIETIMFWAVNLWNKLFTVEKIKQQILLIWLIYCTYCLRETAFSIIKIFIMFGGHKLPMIGPKRNNLKVDMLVSQSMLCIWWYFTTFKRKESLVKSRTQMNPSLMILNFLNQT